MVYTGGGIVKRLDVIFEVCYQVVVKQIDIDLFISIMNETLYMFDDIFWWSVPEGSYDLSIMAIVKNEAYIVEWIEYHLLVGVQYFYIYDNESTDGLKDRIEKYINEGIVTYVYYLGKPVQMQSYNDAIQKFKYETKWLAIIDGDEYLLPMEEEKSLVEILEEVKNNFINHKMRIAANVGAVGVNWRCYGTSNHKEKPQGLCIEEYNYRAQDEYFQNVHIKTIMNPRVVINMPDPHYVLMRKGWICVSDKGSTIPFKYFYDSQCTKLRINHYFSKSEEEFRNKIEKRGLPDGEHDRNVEQELYEATVNCNEVYDDVMKKYVDEVKKRMGE